MRTTDDNVKDLGCIEVRPDDHEDAGDSRSITIDPPRPPEPKPPGLPGPSPEPRRPVRPAPAGRRPNGGRAVLPTWPPLISEI